MQSEVKYLKRLLNLEVLKRARLIAKIKREQSFSSAARRIKQLQIRLQS